MPSVPAYTSIGSGVSDLLKGSAKSGSFTLDNTVKYSGTTSAGLTFNATAVTKGDKIDPVLKAAYAHKQLGYSADVSFDGSSKLGVNASIVDKVLPGLKVTGSVTLPDPNSAKLSLEYAFPYLTTKATASLKSQPVVDLLASTGYKNAILGLETSFDTAKSAVTKYNVALGYHAPDFQVAVSVLDQLNTVKVGYVHNVSPTTKVGTEVVRQLASGNTTVVLGYARSFTTGSLAKLKIDNAGVLTALYETKLQSGEKVSASLQAQSTDLSKPVKYGFAIDLS